SPNRKNKVIIGDRQGNLYISDDEGESWQQSFTFKNVGDITAIAISPNFSSDKTFFVGTEKKGVFKTVDGGISFREVNQGIADKNIRDLVISTHNTKTLDLFASTWNEGVFQLNDGGKSWKKYSDGLSKDSQADEEGFKIPNFSDLAVSSTFDKDKTMFLAGFNGLFKSIDGGQAWQEIETLSVGTIPALAISPNYANDSTIAIVPYVGNPDISKDKGVSWTPLNKGIEIPRIMGNFEKPHQDPRRFFDVAFSPNYASDTTIFATLLWDNLVKSTNGGQSWDIVALRGGGGATRGLTIATSPTFAIDKTIFVGTQYGVIFRSKNGGTNFSVVGKVGNRKTNEPLALVISPDFASDKTLYASGPRGIHQTLDGGVTWQPITDGMPLMKSSNIKLAISP
ncbi:MAG: WD40/YVTN/BNR-like repeat-containing protein, partial [Microcystaceae cyanobacterium]